MAAVALTTTPQQAPLGWLYIQNLTAIDFWWERTAAACTQAGGGKIAANGGILTRDMVDKYPEVWIRSDSGTPSARIISDIRS